MMRIKVISKESEFLALEGTWNQVFDASGTRNIFLSWDWCFYWWKHFGEDKKLLILLVEEGGSVIGIAPLMLVKGRLRTFWMPVVQFIGSDVADYSDFLILPNRKAALSEIWAYLRTRLRWGMWELRKISGDSGNLRFLRNILSESNYPLTNSLFCYSPIAQLQGTWETYYKSISKGLRQDIRTSLNKLSKKGQVNFEIYRGTPGEELFNRIFEIHRKRQVNKVGKSIFEAAAKRKFISDICATFGKRGWLYIPVLKLDQAIISYALGFNYRGIIYYWITAFDPDFAKASPGKLLIKYILENSFQDNQTEFDFMSGEESYKLRWSTTKRAVFELYVYSSHFLYVMELLRRDARKWFVALKTRIRLLEKIRIRLSKVGIPRSQKSG
jgi:CelD/BcsL family acetyltransferase involved in cellulose biosynthesis